MHEGPVVVVSGGGTGGHLYPALAIADALRKRRPDVRVVFVGARRGIEARVLPARGEEHYLVPVYGLDRSNPLASWRAPVGLVVALFRVARIFAHSRPEVVVVTGGYAGAPAGIIAGFTGVPLVLQEQNAQPGLVTRLLTRWAAKIHLAYPDAARRLGTRVPVSVTGNPVRVGSGSDVLQTRTRVGVPADAFLVVVAGGSQGSLAVNRVVTEALRGVVEGALNRPDRLHLLWITGPTHIGGVEETVRALGCGGWVHPVGYVDDLPSVLSAADLAVSRAGAMATAELLDRGLPSILVPLPSAAAGHQMQNARALERAGAARVAPEESLTGERLWHEIERLYSSPEERQAMRATALALARPHAADDIAADVESFLRPSEEEA